MKFIKAFFSQLDFEFVPFAVTGTGTAVMTFGGTEYNLTRIGVGDYSLALKGGRAAGVVIWGLAIARSDSTVTVMNLHDTGSTTNTLRFRSFNATTLAALDCKFAGISIIKRGAREI